MQFKEVRGNYFNRYSCVFDFAAGQKSSKIVSEFDHVYPTIVNRTEKKHAEGVEEGDGVATVNRAHFTKVIIIIFVVIFFLPV